MPVGADVIWICGGIYRSSRVVNASGPVAGLWLRRMGTGGYRHLMPYAWWPLFELRLTAPDLTLRPMREADLPTIADLLPEDVEQDPRATRYALGDRRLSRGIIAHQSYWARAAGSKT